MNEYKFKYNRHTVAWVLAAAAFAAAFVSPLAVIHFFSVQDAWLVLLTMLTLPAVWAVLEFAIIPLLTNSIGTAVFHDDHVVIDLGAVKSVMNYSDITGITLAPMRYHGEAWRIQTKSARKPFVIAPGKRFRKVNYQPLADFMEALKIKSGNKERH